MMQNDNMRSSNFYKTPSNNSFNRSANSVAFIRETFVVIAVRRARLIRALDATSVYPNASS